MKLWISGEIEGNIDEEFRETLHSVEKKVNEYIQNQSYNLNLDSWDCIAIIRSDNEFKEIIRFSPKKRNMDFRLKINFNDFANGNKLDREILFYNMLQRSLNILAEKKNTGEGIVSLKKDLLKVAEINKWKTT